MTSKVDEENLDAPVSDLTLNIYEPVIENKTSDATTAIVQNHSEDVDIRVECEILKDINTNSNKHVKVRNIKRRVCLRSHPYLLFYLISNSFREQNVNWMKT